MSVQLRPEARIKPQVYELAGQYGVGTPQKKYVSIFARIFVALACLVFVFFIGFLCYYIYAYIAFSILSQTYPNIDNVPADQLHNYIHLKVLHDDFWKDILQLGATALQFMVVCLAFYPISRLNVYLCSDGILKIDGKKEEAVRWAEVKEIYTAGGKVTKLVKLDESSFELPVLFGKKKLRELIGEEVEGRLLPEILARYENGEAVMFGNRLIVSQNGIVWDDKLVPWEQIGDVVFEGGKLSVYYLEPAKANKGGLAAAEKGKWHTWLSSDTAVPNLHVFITLVNLELEKQGVEQIQREQRRLVLKEAATIARRKAKKSTRITIAAVVAAVLCPIIIIVSFVVYNGVTEQQRADRDLQLIQGHVKRLAQNAYYAYVPGEHCDHGYGFWEDDDEKNIFVCRDDGLLMTQKDMKYQDVTYFSFDPKDASGKLRFTGTYVPHHYSVQVKAAIVSGGKNTCVSVHVHIQDYAGRQAFNVCASGDWASTSCDLHCNQDTTEACGKLEHAANTYVILVDVTDRWLTLKVNDKTVTTIQDPTYSSTDQIALGLYGDENAGEPITALFSDFRYIPYP